MIRAISDDMFKETRKYHVMVLLFICFGIYTPNLIALSTPNKTATLVLSTFAHINFISNLWHRNRIMIILATFWWYQMNFMDGYWKINFQFTKNEDIPLDMVIPHNLLFLILTIYNYKITIESL